MTIRFPVANLPLHCRGRSEGFSDAVMAAAQIIDGQIVIDSEDWQQLVRQHVGSATTSPAEPTLAELAANFTTALARWSAAGFPTVSAEAYAARAAACDACEHWQPQARLGLGKCAAPGCGCTSLKRWLATEKCPQGKWP